MVFVKIVKNKAYFKRYQVKYRRRREGKTDYRARQKLITQDKTKYNAPKYRFVVRITNRDVITQIIASKIVGDHVIAAAYSHELPRYGLKTGLTNYAACYATGLLLGRRLLQKVGLDKKYEGLKETDGSLEKKDANQKVGPRRPFKAYLDVGLARTTTGARIFGALKGASDAGLYIPHNEKRFPGYNREKKSYDPKVHRERIYGVHVSKYMKLMQEKSDEQYKAHFSRYIKEGVDSKSIEALYKKVHAAIRANPAAQKKERKAPAQQKRFNRKKESLTQRKLKIQAKKERLLKKLAEE
jgi:large subunit ribosomal protein L5e